MSKTVTITLCLCLFLLTLSQAIEAQDQAIGTRVSSAEESSNREQDGLKGPVRRVRLERAQIFVKEGEWVEGRRELQWVATYDLQGRKIDSVAYPLEGSSLTGKEQYQYDEKGNIIEMVARGDDGSVLSKENYRYEFDELGNWKKMTSSIAVYENGKVSYEPIEVSYRTIAYYYGQAIDKLASGVRADSSLTSNHTAKPSTPTKSTEVSGAAESVRPANAIGSSVSGNQAKTGTVKESSVATVGDGSAVTRAATITPAVGNTASAGNEKVSVKQGAEQETRNATLNLPKPTAKITSVVSSTESSGENRKVKNTGRDETSSNLISSTRTAPSPTNNTSDSSGPSTSLYQEGLRYLAAGNYEQAVEAFNQSIRLNPNDAIVYLKLGSAYSALRKYKEAVIGLKMAIRMKPEIVNAEAYYYLGYSYSERGNHKDALEAFRQALYLTRAEVIDKDETEAQSFPALEQIHYSLGRSYLNLGRYQEAIKELNEAVKLNPKLAKAYYELGIAYLRLRDRSSAQRQQTTLISLNAALAKQLADALSTRNRQDFPCAGSIYFCR